MPLWAGEWCSGMPWIGNGGLHETGRSLINGSWCVSIESRGTFGLPLSPVIVSIKCLILSGPVFYVS